MATVITNTDIGSNLYTSGGKLYAREQLRGNNYKVVYANNVAVNNGTDLYNAYQLAKVTSPNGLPKSETNRFVVFLAPGVYTFNTGFPVTLDLDTPFIDIVSLSGEADVVITTQVGGTSPITVSTSDTRLKGINLNGQNIQITNLYSNNYFENIIGGDYNFSSGTSGYGVAGSFKNCTGGDFSFANSDNNELLVFSTLENCTAGEYSFGYSIYNSELTNCSSGSNSFGTNTLDEVILTNCTSNNNNGCFGAYMQINSCTLTNCSSGAFSFATPDVGGTSIVNSTFKECSANNWAFGEVIDSSTLIDCTAGPFSFGKNQIINSSKLINCTTNGGADSFGCEIGITDSVLTNCSSGGYSFGRTNVLASVTSIENSQLTNCVALDNSFAVNNTSSTFIDCTGGTESFGANSANGTYKNCKALNNSFGAGVVGWVDLIAGGNFYNCEADYFSFGTNFANGNFYSCKAGNASFQGTSQGGFGGSAYYTIGINPAGPGMAMYCADTSSNPVNFNLASTTNNI